MKYYITTTSEQAYGISALKAQQEGCAGVTVFWWSVITHPQTGEAALSISDEECELAPAEKVKILYVNGLNQITTDDLETQEYMELNGWLQE